MTEKQPGLISRYSEHYRVTRSEHRPLPVLYPFAAITVLVIIAFLFLDPIAAGLYGRWPAWLANSAAHVTDVGRSWWILTLTAAIILGGWIMQRLSKSASVGRIATSATSMAVFILFSVGLAALIANIIKSAIGRPRPIMSGDNGLFSFHPFAWNYDFESFPSGHATVNGALFMALALLFPRFRWPLLILGVCFAMTRVFVGAHFPSDVTAGFGFGMWFAFVAALLFSRIGVLFDTRDSKLAHKA
ncbi:MAG: phosphatase [Rhizobium sp.]|nr:phosphatase [Rhizobium sp.]